MIEKLQKKTFKIIITSIAIVLVSFFLPYFSYGKFGQFDISIIGIELFYEPAVPVSMAVAALLGIMIVLQCAKTKFFHSKIFNALIVITAILMIASVVYLLIKLNNVYSVFAMTQNYGIGLILNCVFSVIAGISAILHVVINTK